MYNYNRVKLNSCNYRLGVAERQGEGLLKLCFPHGDTMYFHQQRMKPSTNSVLAVLEV